MTLRVGIIGLGVMGEYHARRLTKVLSGVSVVALADTDINRVNQLAESLLPGASIYDSGLDLIASSEVDAVIVASWGSTHEEFVLAAIAAGKPVFCEKPLAPTSLACSRIIEAESARGKRLVQVGFMRRYDPGYQGLRRALDEGAIGATLLAHCAHRNLAAPPWFTGDLSLTDSAVHEIDIMRWLLSDEITAVSVILPRRTRYAEAQLQDPCLLLMETAAGVHIDVELFLNCRYGYDIRCELVGETGTLSLANPVQLTRRSSGGVIEPVPADWSERFGLAYDAELQEWVNAVRDGKLVGPSSWDGYAACTVAETAVAALESQKRTKVVTMERPLFYSLLGRIGVLPSWLKLVRTSAGVDDDFEGLAEVVGEGVGGGDGVLASLDLNGAVAAGDLDEFPD